MSKEKTDSVLQGISGILDSLGNLAEKGRQLKEVINQEKSKSDFVANSLQELHTDLETLDSSWILNAKADNLINTDVDVEVKDDNLCIKITEGHQIAYKNVEIAPGFRIDSIRVHNNTGHIVVKCSR